MSDRLIITLERNGKKISWASKVSPELTWDLITAVLLSEIEDIFQKRPELLCDEVNEDDDS